MAYLRLQDFAEKRVDNPMMNLGSGVIGLGSYTRNRHNLVLSPTLKQRMKTVARAMRDNCSLPDKCLPSSMSDRAIGSPVPGKPGKVYTRCSSEEAASRIRNAAECGKMQLSTKGGVYGRGA